MGAEKPRYGCKLFTFPFISSPFPSGLAKDGISKKIPPTFSFEFFPPQTPEGMEKLRATRRQLAQLKPKFFSVTFGAGGSTRDRTLETVLEIQAEGYVAAPHLSCIGSTSERSRAMLEKYRRGAFAISSP